MATTLQTIEEGQTGHLRATFAVEPDEAVNCAVLSSGCRGEDVDQNIIFDDGPRGPGGRCRSAVTLETGDRQFLASAVDEGCICPVFSSHDCIASIQRFEPGSLEVDVMVPDRDELEAVVVALRRTGATVRLRRIATRTDGDADQHLELEVEGITEKQREAVLLAVDAGYYETPRQTDLGELAERLGVSKSAVSQRLSAVESNLVTSLFERESAGQTER
ncbi:helix-turn-helix domain-containing protein [Halovivax gelatinilyticus]|uniref:helix-turn-helix domain-containing protein n=1 Tax=Halovivax gelatinilyticus TaxID=2961597 RepID=UPI0020CA4926|nr:helix-turn-helix domain-containing protein [Halovivax gelatinilyticus]